MAPRKGLNLDEIANLFRDITENESDDGQLSCSILNSDEDIRLSETFSIIPSLPWGIVVSDADCGALARFESRIRHGCLRCNPSLLSDVRVIRRILRIYVIRRSSEDVCRLEMEFLRFDVESSSNCEYDYLAINGEKICGLIENTTRTYLFQDYEKQLTFHSDSGTSRPGFMIRVKQVDCSVVTTEPPLPPSKPCDQSFSSSVFEIRSDNHPDNYDPHLRCVYTVSKAHPGVCAIELTFLTFDVEASDGCQYDYLKLQEERLCGIYPSNLKRIVPFEESEVILEFHSDGATSRPGFHIRGQQMDCAPLADKVIPPTPAGGCDATFTNGSGTIQSPGFPEPYPSSRRCVYRFVALPEHCRITLQFLEFGLQTDDALCEKDFLRINGIKYCGPQLLGQKRTVTFYGYPREVNVTFESDEQLSDKGFYAVYRQLPCSPALEIQFVHGDEILLIQDLPNGEGGNFSLTAGIQIPENIR
ncbi:UNVERIFIED_CONTAM: tll2 [Trichonephila clavipes]